jgi:hypothetical protein
MASAFDDWSAFDDLIPYDPDALGIATLVVLHPDTALTWPQCAGIYVVVAQGSLWQLQVVFIHGQP